jgi:hypothetical protein
MSDRGDSDTERRSLEDAERRSLEAGFVTTEHFTLQGARAATIAESTGRATMFLGAVSGGLVALGLIATATGIGGAFFAFGLVLLPTLAFLGLVTFHRVLQSGIEDHYYARRIAHLRGYYFSRAPGVAGYLLSVSPADRLKIEGMPGARRWQGLLTVAGMTAVITAVLAGSAVALAAAAGSHHALSWALALGVPSGVAVLVGLLLVQRRVWLRALDEPMFADESLAGRRVVSRAESRDRRHFDKAA